MFHKVKAVRPLTNMKLYVEFVSGDVKCYDVKPLMHKFEVFKDLSHGDIFNLVHVDSGGYGIIWNDYIDLACDELWENGSGIDMLESVAY